ncbi:hypothetical protein [Clostridium taeniosporum]|uniref:Uncharacterized protein n=1 Tax=Clostridium taeniosporum TaxID=394958 RepID=A0A1D7XP50_9CLOT|nr:hypothetical protein [Clostridium taeniosporum]AOR25067.1 hypothetical protein BGI42_15075 [Clostridium taeniosporum]
MVRKKNPIKPVVAKPLNDNGKRNLVTNFVTTNVNKNTTENNTDKVTKKDTKNVTKKLTITKSILIGKKEITAKFTSNKRLRPNYNLSEDTIEKIEKISAILGYKKAEFLDIYLNGTLEKLIKKLEKDMK